MTDDDLLLCEIFHEAREALGADTCSTQTEEPTSRVQPLWTNLNIAASDTWKSHEDSFKFACRKIKTRALEIENRMKRVTSGDILASLKVYAQTNVPVHKSTQPKRVSSESIPVQKKVRFLVPQDQILDTSTNDGIEQDSLLYSIRQWYDPTAARYSNLPDSETKTLGADRVWTKGDSDVEVTEYNNPFDPRLTFNGLTDHIIARKADRETEDKDSRGNILLWLDKVSDVVDECLYKYTRYLRSLREEPFVVKKSTAKSELLATSLTATHKFTDSKNESSHNKPLGVSDEERLIRQICSVRKIWDESQGSFIPRRITSRKPALFSKRRTPFVSQIKPSAWPNFLLLSRGTDETLSVESHTEKPLNKEEPVKEESHFTPTEPVENEQKAPSIWQKIAEEHIDEESLKHLQNATKERAGVKIMRPTLPSSDSTDETTKTLTTRTATLTAVFKPDSWAARVAQNPITSSCSTFNTSIQGYANEKHENSMPCTESKVTPQTTTSVHPTRTDSTASTNINRPKEDKKILIDVPIKVSPGKTKGQKIPDTLFPVSASPALSQTTTLPKSNTTWKDVASVALISGQNQPNSSTDWFKKLLASRREVTVGVKETVPSQSATFVSKSSKELTANALRDRSTVESKSEPNTGDLQQTVPPVAEFRHRLPPGFEKTILETRIPPMSGPPPPRAAHATQGNHWQIPGVGYAGVGETYAHPAATTYQHGQPRISQQFQRPIAQLGGNLAFWHPRPNHGSYMLTDANGKTVGMGIPTWNRVDLHGRPHVLVHQTPVPSGSSVRAAMHQPPRFATGADNYVQQSFTSTVPPPPPHPLIPKLPDLLTTANRPSTGYERGDHFPGYLPTGIQAPQTNYRGERLVPQFIPTMHQPPPLFHEYTMFTPNQHKLNPPFLRPHMANSNNNCSTNSDDTVSLFDNADTSEKTVRAIVRRPVKVYKVSRAVRANLIQLA